MSKTVAIAIVLGFVAIIGAAIYWQRSLGSELPPREECDSAADALGKATGYKLSNGGRIVSVLGTGSMVPYIPASSAGRDPKTTIVAFAVVSGAYADLAPGTLCTYAPAFAPELVYIHVAAAHDSLGWIMSGLNNRQYEHDWRVTPENFRGIVRIVFVIRQP